MAELLQAFEIFIKSVLPTSPFRGLIDSIGSFEYLGWLNWFFPVGGCLTILKGWVAIISAYYLYSIVLRWIKAIH